MFQHIPLAPPDSILGLTEAFRKDTNPKKVNLGVGVFKDESGQTPILTSVKKAETRLLEKEKSKSYLPIGGGAIFAEQTMDLVFGNHPALAEKRVRTVQTPGGTGALRVGADFLARWMPKASTWVSNPTWANHKGIFAAAHLPIKEYPYYNPANRGVDFAAMKSALQEIPAGDIVLLHVCCHNPTGADLTPAEWAEVAAIAQRQGWLPFFDFAYQGFGDGIEEDRAPLQEFLNAGLEFLVASSYSKNFGLYNERVGALSMVARDVDTADKVFSNVEIAIRVNYSNPSNHGGAIVAEVLSDAELRAEWMGELAAMRGRIKTLRAKLVDGLQARGVKQDFSFINRQRGMFSFSGLTDEQVAALRGEKAIYIVKGGRINVAGLSNASLAYVCDAIASL